MKRCQYSSFENFCPYHYRNQISCCRDLPSPSHNYLEIIPFWIFGTLPIRDSHIAPSSPRSSTENISRGFVNILQRQPTSGSSAGPGRRIFLSDAQTNRKFPFYNPTDPHAPKGAVATRHARGGLDAGQAGAEEGVNYAGPAGHPDHVRPGNRHAFRSRPFSGRKKQRIYSTQTATTRRPPSESWATLKNNRHDPYHFLSSSAWFFPTRAMLL
jgi:hypothetical protein